MRRMVTYAAMALLLGCAPAFAAGGHINKRQARQQHRIAEGIENGTLTPRESARLEHQESRINALEAKDRSGGLSPKEHAQLNRLLNTESHRIYAQKHDGHGRS